MCGKNGRHRCVPMTNCALKSTSSSLLFAPILLSQQHENIFFINNTIYTRIELYFKKKCVLGPQRQRQRQRQRGKRKKKKKKPCLSPGWCATHQSTSAALHAMKCGGKQWEKFKKKQKKIKKEAPAHPSFATNNDFHNLEPLHHTSTLWRARHKK